jgi:hypothetical protein
MILREGHEYFADFQQCSHLFEQILAKPDPDAGNNFVITGPSHMHPPTRLDTQRFDQQRLDTGMHIFEPVIEYFIRNTIVMVSEQCRKQLACCSMIIDLLSVEHEYMGDIDEDVCLGNVPVCMHR